MITFDAISEKYGEAKQDLIAAQLEVDDLERKAMQMREQRETANWELDRLLELEQADHISRVLDGEDTSPKKPKRLTRIANLQEEVAGIDLAVPIHQRRLEDARAKLQAARERIGQAVLPSILDQKSAAFQRCAQPLESLVSALVDAAALDLLQEQFAGAHGQIKVATSIDTSKMFSARKILDRFKSTLPPRFANLASASLAAADRQIEDRAKTFATQIGA